MPKIEVENECGAEEEEEAVRTKRTASGKYTPATPAGMGGERLDTPAGPAVPPHLAELQVLNLLALLVQNYK